jgi:thioredoxin-like negative regulator of GroEL
VFEVAMGFEGEQQERSLRTIADQWSRNEPEQALKWAEALTSEGRVGVIEEALENWVRKDAESTVAYLDKMEASERDSIMKEVVEQWARVGGDATADAAKWVASQDDGKGKVDATGEVVGQWMRSDPEAASEWLGEQPVGDARDRGAAALLRDQISSTGQLPLQSRQPYPYRHPEKQPT